MCEEHPKGWCAPQKNVKFGVRKGVLNLFSTCLLPFSGAPWSKDLHSVGLTQVTQGVESPNNMCMRRAMAPGPQYLM